MNYDIKNYYDTSKLHYSLLDSSNSFSSCAMTFAEFDASFARAFLSRSRSTNNYTQKKIHVNK
jgi:hypothetical protein